MLKVINKIINFFRGEFLRNLKEKLVSLEDEAESQRQQEQPEEEKKCDSGSNS